MIIQKQAKIKEIYKLEMQAAKKIQKFFRNLISPNQTELPDDPEINIKIVKPL